MIIPFYSTFQFFISMS